MVEDRITDGKRIAQLLSSELTGRETGPLAAVDVVDADPEAEPAPEGTVAYAVAHRDRRIGEVVLYPEAAALVLTFDPDRVSRALRGPDLSVVPDETRLSNVEGTTARVTVRIEAGAAVKRAVDALVAGLESD